MIGRAPRRTCRMSASPTSGDALPVTGCSIVEGDAMDDGRAVTNGHPFLEGAPSTFSVDIERLEPIEI